MSNPTLWLFQLDQQLSGFKQRMPDNLTVSQETELRQAMDQLLAICASVINPTEKEQGNKSEYK